MNNLKVIFSVKEYLTDLIKSAYATKCICCEYVYGNLHPFVVICENYCYMCSICLKNMKGLDLFVLCPNKKCNGKFMTSYLKKKISDPKFKDELGELFYIDPQLKDKIIVDKNFLNEDVEIVKKENINNEDVYSQPLSSIEKDDELYSESLDTKLTPNKIYIETKRKEFIDIPIMPFTRPSIISEEKIDASCNTSVNNLLTCPNCRIAIELFPGGCNIVNCTSPIKCRGKFNFCKLCKKPLNSNDLSIHYPFGKYRSECLNYSKKKI